MKIQKKERSSYKKNCELDRDERMRMLLKKTCVIY